MGGVGLRTTFDFLLPKGYVDGDGRLHRRGEMRLATARDEIEPLRDPRVTANDAYLTVLVLARVVTRLGDITNVTPSVIEGLFASDLAYLQDFYGIANFGDQSQLVTQFDDEPEAAADDHAEDGPTPLQRASVEEMVPAMEG